MCGGDICVMWVVTSVLIVWVVTGILIVWVVYRRFNCVGGDRQALCG